MGFANLPNQVYRKSVKRGFEFTLMVVGKWKTLFSSVVCFSPYDIMHALLCLDDCWSSGCRFICAAVTRMCGIQNIQLHLIS